MKILYYLAATGEPFYEIKKQIFFDNIKTISYEINDKIDVNINLYTEDKNFEDLIKKSIYINNSYIYNKKGILPELFLTNPYNDKIMDYDYVIFIVYDVSIVNCKILDLINIKNKYKLDIISPSIINPCWAFMNPFKPNRLKLANAVEFYMYVVDPNNLYKIFKYHDINNVLCWGHAQMLGFFGFKSGIYSNAICNHKFRQYQNKKLENISGKNLETEFIKKYNFNHIDEVINKFPPIIKEINTYI